MNIYNLYSFAEEVAESWRAFQKYLSKYAQRFGENLGKTFFRGANNGPVVLSSKATYFRRADTVNINTNIPLIRGNR